MALRFQHQYHDDPGVFIVMKSSPNNIFKILDDGCEMVAVVRLLNNSVKYIGFLIYTLKLSCKYKTD